MRKVKGFLDELSGRKTNKIPHDEKERRKRYYNLEEEIKKGIQENENLEQKSIEEAKRIYIK